MGLAGVINLTMLVVAASLFHATGNTGVDTIEGAHAGFERLIGGGARSRSPSRCSPPGCRARASARTRGRS
jgi:Mn2+/Fe2+ NRAMP family transporter